MMCASPGASPNTARTSIRVSMQVRTATFRRGRELRSGTASRSVREAAAASMSSAEDTAEHRRRTAVGGLVLPASSLPCVHDERLNGEIVQAAPNGIRVCPRDVDEQRDAYQEDRCTAEHEPPEQAFAYRHPAPRERVAVASNNRQKQPA